MCNSIMSSLTKKEPIFGASVPLASYYSSTAMSKSMLILLFITNFYRMSLYDQSTKPGLPSLGVS